MSDTARATSEPETPPAVYDATTLGKPRMFVLGIQHMFAMFGATILVPVLTGLSVSDTLLFAGLGTLLFHILAKGKVPAFLGSSFAFIAGYAAIAPNGEAELLPYACLGVACAGLLYLVLSALFRAFGPARVMRFFPPVVTPLSFASASSWRVRPSRTAPPTGLWRLSLSQPLWSAIFGGAAW